jgi:hypothetical protein
MLYKILQEMLFLMLTGCPVSLLLIMSNIIALGILLQAFPVIEVIFIFRAVIHFFVLYIS